MYDIKYIIWYILYNMCIIKYVYIYISISMAELKYFTNLKIAKMKPFVENSP